MKRTGLLFLSSLALLGCQQDTSKQNEAVIKKLDEMEKAIVGAIKSQPAGRGAAPPARPARPRPNPTAVYSVNIDNAPFKGAKDAKITVVEAFEFA